MNMYFCIDKSNFGINQILIIENSDYDAGYGHL